jgi:hypothetical protein
MVVYEAGRPCSSRRTGKLAARLRAKERPRGNQAQYSGLENGRLFCGRKRRRRRRSDLVNCGELVSFIGMLLSFFCLAYLAFRGVNIIIASMVASALLALFSGLNPFTVLSGVYLQGFTEFLRKYFLIFVFSAIFGSLMAESGATQTIAFYMQKLVMRCPEKYRKTAAICSVALVNAILTYGGMSLFVVVFTLVYIAKDLFEELDIPWYLYSCSSLGSAAFTMTMLPGSPQLPNIIPTTYLGTTPMAAPGLGLIGAAISLTAGVWFIYFVSKRAERRGDGFLPSGSGRRRRFPLRAEEADASLEVPAALRCAAARHEPAGTEGGSCPVHGGRRLLPRLPARHIEHQTGAGARRHQRGERHRNT